MHINLPLQDESGRYCKYFTTKLTDSRCFSYKKPKGLNFNVLSDTPPLIAYYFELMHGSNYLKEFKV